MKIIIISYLPILPLSGGSSIRVYNYVKEFCRSGHDVQVIAPLHARMGDVYAKIGRIAVEPINEISISRFERHRELRYLLYILFSAFKCLRALRTRPAPDVLISHNCVSLLGALPLAKLRRIPLVLDLTDILTGFFQFYKIPNPFKGLLKALVSFEVRLCRMADKIIVVSDALKDVIVSYGVDSDKVAVVNDGVNTSLFNNNVFDDQVRNKLHLDRGPVILFMGMIDAYQGVEYLVRAAPKILAKFPGAKFLIIGEGTALGSTRRVARNLKVYSSFIFAGWVPHEEIPKYIQCADVCVITHPPGFSNEILFPVKLIEYWAMGKPVVAPRLKNIASIVKDGEVGMLYEPANSKELADSIIDLLLDRKRARSLGAEARKLAMSRFTWDKLTSHFVDICERVAIAFRRKFGA